jgi:hypothetical protein
MRPSAAGLGGSSGRPDLHASAAGARPGEPPLPLRLPGERGGAGLAAVIALVPGRERDARSGALAPEAAPCGSWSVDAAALDPAESQAGAGIRRGLQHEGVHRSGLARTPRRPGKGGRREGRPLAPRPGRGNAAGRSGTRRSEASGRCRLATFTADGRDPTGWSFDPVHPCPRLDRPGRPAERGGGPLLRHPASDAREGQSPALALRDGQRGAAVLAAVEPMDLAPAQEARADLDRAARRAVAEGHQCDGDRLEGDREEEHSIHSRRDATGARGPGQARCMHTCPNGIMGVGRSAGG